MSRVGFEPTIPVFEGANTFDALDGAAIVIGTLDLIVLNVVLLQLRRRVQIMKFLNMYVPPSSCYFLLVIRWNCLTS
jgi:hypothetical protein